MNILIFKIRILLFVTLVSLCFCGKKVVQEKAENTTPENIAFLRNKSIGKGINFGNALEAPAEGDWGLTIKEEYIQAVKDAGFNSVRLPIAWSSHTSQVSPYAIDTNFLNRVDEIVGWCHDRELTVIITIHHFNDFYAQPENELYRNMFFSIWEQLTNHYLDVNHDKLIFEPLNEPHDNLIASLWNDLIPEFLEVIRAIDTDRTLIIDPPNWASHWELENLEIPADEQNVIVSVRYYLPYPFTHQGAHWVNNSDQWLGTTWTSTTSQKNEIISHMNTIKSWAEANNRPITIGEYGAIIEADLESRLRWTKFVRKQFEENEFSWTYFDFGVLFEAYDIDNNQWIDGFSDSFFE